jgi:FkbM family methyltransferase
LAFDIGAHAGDRTACFKSLGARVVAIEPQPPFARFLKWNHWGNNDVTVLCGVVSRSSGQQTLYVNSRNPTVSTLSDGFVQAAEQAGQSWQGQQWDRAIEVQAFSLDSLIAQHGVPDFIKIDVEGAELEVLLGLSQAVAALTFEFTLIQLALAHECLDRCEALGMTRFNASLGESHDWVFGDWQDIESIKDWIDQLPVSANSGDIYVRSA